MCYAYARDSGEPLVRLNFRLIAEIVGYLRRFSENRTRLTAQVFHGVLTKSECGDARNRAGSDGDL